MRLTPMGRLAVLLVALGTAVGGWRIWQQQAGTGGGGGKSTGGSWKLPRLPFVGGNGGDGGGNGDILLITSATKKGWLMDEIEKFNKSNGDGYRVTTKFIETREAMHAILDGKQRPVLWSPSSSIWANRLAQVWMARNGSTLISVEDPWSYHVFMRSPMLFLTTRAKVNFLRPILGGPACWQQVRDLSMGRRRVPWGTFKFSVADPINANSGMLTLGMILLDYSRRMGQMGAMERVAGSSGFGGHLKELGHSLIYDTPAAKGSSTLLQAFLEDTEHYDFITTYESSALDAVAQHPNLAVIYPDPTVVSEHTVCRLSSGWVSPQQAAGAKAFMQFLGSKASLEDGVQSNLRPLQSGVAIPPAIAANAAHGFQQSFDAAELPPYAALNGAAVQWRNNIVRRP